MMTTEHRIALTADPTHRAKLRRKLDEYRERVSRQVNDSSLPYRICILETLFAVGFVDIHQLQARLATMPTYNETDFHEALQIVAAYNENQLAKLRNGTGLQ